jgi:zinc protease
MNRRVRFAFRPLLLAGLLCSGAGFVAAQPAAPASGASNAAPPNDPLATPPPPAAPRPLSIAAPKEQRLPNGVRVVVAERPGVPLVSLRLVVSRGAEADPPQRAGLASLTANLLTRGSTRHGAPALATAAEALGGSLQAGAGWNTSGIGITVMTPMAGRAMALLAEVALQPAFAQAELDRLREQVLDDLKVAYANPGTLASLAVQRATFGGTAYGHPVNGTPASLPRITRQDLLTLHRQAWRPEQAVMVFAGDVTLAQAVALAQQHLGGWRAAPAAGVADAAAVKVDAAALAAAAAPAPVVVDMPGAGQAGVAVALQAVPAASRERHAAAVTNSVLGQGYSSRLNQEIRIKRGLSYGVGSNLDLRRDAGVLRLGVQTKNPSAPEVLQLVGSELDRLAAEPVPAAELAARKAALIGNFGRAMETTAGLADEAGALALAGLPLTDLNQRITNLDAVSAAEVQAFAKAHFGTAQRRFAVAGVASEFASQLGNGWRVVPVMELVKEADSR